MFLPADRASSRFTATVLAAQRMIADDPAPEAPARLLSWETRALLALCLLPIGALIVEG